MSTHMYYEITLACIQHVTANIWTMPGNFFRKQLTQAKMDTKELSENLALQAFKFHSTNLYLQYFGFL